MSCSKNTQKRATQGPAPETRTPEPTQQPAASLTAELEEEEEGRKNREKGKGDMKEGKGEKGKSKRNLK